MHDGHKRIAEVAIILAALILGAVIWFWMQSEPTAPAPVVTTATDTNSPAPPVLSGTKTEQSAQLLQYDLKRSAADANNPQKLQQAADLLQQDLTRTKK